MLNSYLYIFSIYIASASKVFWKFPQDSKKVIKELNLILAKNNHSLEIGLVKRIQLYVVLSSHTNSWFCALRGYKASIRENKNMLYLAAIMPLLDNLTDSLKIKSEAIIKDIKIGNDSLHPTMPIIRYLYNKLSENCSDLFINTFHKALKVQDKSILQLSDVIIDDLLLKQITFEKGGISVLLLRLVLDNSLVENEEEIIYKLGYNIQLINDMFDVYKDSKDKQQTLFTNATDIQINAKEFYESIDKITTGFLSLDYNNKNIKKSLCEISTITSIGKVCIEQLLECQASTNGVFSLDSYQRKQLVCNMHTLPNTIKTYKYGVRYYQKI